MKHLKLFELFTKSEVKTFISKAEKNSEIKLNVNIDELLKKLKEPSEKTNFEKFVESEASFISEGDYKRMEEYIEEFKKLNLDVSILEKLYPKLKRYKEIQYKDLYYGEFVDLKKKERNRKISELNKELDILQPFVDEFIKEIKIIAKKCNNL
jgi:hypothetical protein